MLIAVGTTKLSAFKGTLIRPDDPDFDAARQLWNGAIDRRPALIARCADESDARIALRYGLERGLPISVRGGGHNVAGSALADGGVVVDFSGLRGVTVDPNKRLAWVQPGAVWGDVDVATQRHGLATPAGVVSQTGVAGLTVGGGFGWLSRRWGLTSDNLVAVRMLLADGRLVRASEDEMSDLFWAVRGGGGNFGIVTEFEFRLFDLGTEVLAGPLLYRADQAGDVLRAYNDLIAAAPSELAVYANMRTAPALEWVPEGLRGSDVLILIPCFTGNLADGEAILEPFRRSVRPLADLVKRKPYVAHQSMFDAAVPPHWGYYWKSHYLPQLTDPAINVIAEHAWKKSSAASFSILFHLGGAITERPEETSAARGRDAVLALNINAAWPEGGPSHADIEWCQAYIAAMTPHATGGVYVNFLHNDEGEARIRAAYGSSYDRLAQIKARYDPGNVFRSNQNIRPAITSG